MPAVGPATAESDMNLAERAAATEAVIDRFRDKPFDWAGANCIRLARAQGVALGHALPPVPLFRSATGARRALAKRGAASVAELMDQFFPRWPAPAFARVGDLCLLPGDPDDGGPDAVCVADGRGNLMGWHWTFPGLGAIKGAQSAVIVAWRL